MQLASQLSCPQNVSALREVTGIFFTSLRQTLLRSEKPNVPEVPSGVHNKTQYLLTSFSISIVLRSGISQPSTHTKECYRRGCGVLLLSPMSFYRESGRVRNAHLKPFWGDGLTRILFWLIQNIKFAGGGTAVFFSSTPLTISEWHDHNLFSSLTRNK